MRSSMASESNNMPIFPFHEPAILTSFSVFPLFAWKVRAEWQAFVKPVQQLSPDRLVCLPSTKIL